MYVLVICNGSLCFRTNVKQELSKDMDGEVKEIILSKSDIHGFGFSIIGGKGSCLPPVICDIVENSPADLSGEVSCFCV